MVTAREGFLALSFRVMIMATAPSEVAEQWSSRKGDAIIRLSLTSSRVTGFWNRA